MPNPITVASAKIGLDAITIELIEPPDAPATVMITWPKKRLSISTRRFPRAGGLAHSALRRRIYGAGPDEGR